MCGGNSFASAQMEKFCLQADRQSWCAFTVQSTRREGCRPATGHHTTGACRPHLTGRGSLPVEGAEPTLACFNPRKYATTVVLCRPCHGSPAAPEIHAPSEARLTVVAWVQWFAVDQGLDALAVLAMRTPLGSGRLMCGCTLSRTARRQGYPRPARRPPPSASQKKSACDDEALYAKQGPDPKLGAPRLELTRLHAACGEIGSSRATRQQHRRTASR